MPDTPRYDDVHYRSADGRLSLYARDYNRQAERVVLCLHGLTRNSADFEPMIGRLAERLAPTHRFIVVDQRGRGRSEWDTDKTQYNLGIYVQDMLRLLDYLAVSRATFIGTSMGGLISMVLAAGAAPRVRGIVLNDVGPKLSPEGLDRIRSYVGKGKPVLSWADAADAMRDINVEAFPDFGPDEWMAFARRTHVARDGRPVAAYDPAIAEGLAPGSEAVAPQELWELWAGLAAIPMLAIRGGLSDLLSEDTLRRMADAHPGLTTLTLPNRGHAPVLDEPDAVTAIADFLRQQDERV